MPARLNLLGQAAENLFPCGVTSLSGTGYNNNNRPNLNPGVSCNSGTSGLQVFNPNAFTLIGFHIGSVGNAPRGICHGPHYVNADLELSKNWQFKEKYRLRFSIGLLQRVQSPAVRRKYHSGYRQPGRFLLQRQRRLLRSDARGCRDHPHGPRHRAVI